MASNIKVNFDQDTFIKTFGENDTPSNITKISAIRGILHPLNHEPRIIKKPRVVKNQPQGMI